MVAINYAMVEYLSKSHKWTFIVVSEQNDSEKQLSHNLGIYTIYVMCYLANECS